MASTMTSIADAVPDNANQMKRKQVKGAEKAGSQKTLKMENSDSVTIERPDEPIVDSSGYLFVKLDDLPTLRQSIRDYHQAETPQLKGTILLSPEGVNIRLSGYASDVEKMKRCFETVTNNAIKNVHYKDMEMTRTAVLDTKLSITRFLVKLKKEVISMGVDEANPALAQTPAKHLEPKEFKKWLDEDRDVLILDTRNDYEVVLGTFKNAKHFDIHTFREFPQAVKESKLLKDVKAEEEKTGKKKDIVMFCTGGVRCEKAAFCFKQAGFHSENLYQLNGGILHYLQEVLPLIKDNQDNTEEQDKPASESPVEESTATDAQPTDTTGAPLEMDEEKYKQIEKETHYEGECFVFDDRVSVRGVDLKVAGSVLCGSCLHPFSKAQQQTMRAAGGDMKCPGCEVEDVLNISRPARC